MEVQDSTIIEEILKGDKQKYALLMKKYNQRLYRIGKGYLKDEAEIEDVMQEAYIKGYQNLSKFENRSEFATWITRILINECLQRIKKKKRVALIDNNEENNVTMNLPYYKCNTKGCKCNRNANEVNRQFENMLDGFKVSKENIPLIKEQLLFTFQQHNESLQENESAITCQLTDISQKLERLEERFILEELTGELYAKYKAKFEKEMEEIEAQMAGNKIEMSKLEDYIAFSLMCCSNLSEMWALGDYYQRQELQNALFESGIVYDRQKDECRSTGDNEFVSASAELSKDLSIFESENKKKGDLSSVSTHRAESRCVHILRSEGIHGSRLRPT